MKYFYCFPLAIFFIPSLAIAQSNYKPGYVVTMKGDTSKGFIDYREWDKNPVRVNFKSDMAKTEPDKLSPDNISAFAINGLEYYESYKVSVSMAQVDVEKLTTGVDTSSAMENIFLRLLTKGKNISLYEYKDDIKNRFYVKDNASAKPEELIYRIYLNPADVTQSITQPRYQNQLQQFALKYHQSNDKLTAIIEKAGYNENDITDVVNVINQSTSKTDRANRAKPIRLFAGVAINDASLKYSGDTYLNLAPTSSPASFGPRLAIGLDAFLNPNVGRLILRAELSFATASLKTSSNTTPFASQSVKILTPSVIPQLIYNIYDTGPLKCYVGAGASINLYISSDNNYYYAQDPYVPKAVIKGYPNIAATGASFITRIGVVLNKKYELYAIYSPSAVVTDHYGSFAGAITSYQAGVNYLFGAK
jgi:hypothetical protein